MGLRGWKMFLLFATTIVAVAYAGSVQDKFEEVGECEVCYNVRLCSCHSIYVHTYITTAEQSSLCLQLQGRSGRV